MYFLNVFNGLLLTSLQQLQNLALCNLRRLDDSECFPEVRKVLP